MSDAGNKCAFLIDWGQDSDDNPRGIIHVEVHPSVKANEASEFNGCSESLTVDLCGEGLEEIGAGAFLECTSLQAIVIPHSSKVILDDTFNSRSDSMRVDLDEGFEEIGAGAFLECTSLQAIVIPPSV
jgi:hypothetical protein